MVPLSLKIEESRSLDIFRMRISFIVEKVREHNLVATTIEIVMVTTMDTPPRILRYFLKQMTFQVISSHKKTISHIHNVLVRIKKCAEFVIKMELAARMIS